MFKQVQFAGSTQDGIFCQALFGSAGAFEKTAGAPPFADWETGDELRKYISGITASDRKRYCYTLVNALGAGEYFGSNINADYFPWNSLCHEGDDYGYKTFLGAHAYQHHKNKDPTRAFGVPVLSALNHRMKRVELIVRLDREKARYEGADGIITRIDAGDFPDVSMGCKVPYDVCSKCGHKSRTRQDYCAHMNPPAEMRHMFGPNKILPDGTKIYVINLTPRFFDISFVFIGADKTAKVMAKLASVGGMVCLGDVCAVPRPSADVYTMTEGGIYVPEGVEKTASACACDCNDECGGDKLAESFLKAAEAARPNEEDGRYNCGAFMATRPKKKLAEIIKEVPTGVFSMKNLPAVEANESDISPKTLDLISKLRLPSALAALSVMGIVLKPHEFSHIILRKMGEDDLAEDLEHKELAPKPTNEFTETPIDLDDVATVVAEIQDAVGRLDDVIRERSVFGNPFAQRVMRAGNLKKIPLPTRKVVEHPLLDKISAAYNGYRREVLTKLGQAAGLAKRDPQLREVILGDALVDIFSKTANDANQVMTHDSLSYVMGAFLNDRRLLSTTAGAVVDDESLVEALSAQGF